MGNFEQFLGHEQKRKGQQYRKFYEFPGALDTPVVQCVRIIGASVLK